MLTLVEMALHCSRSDALRWLEGKCGLDAGRSFTQEERVQRANQFAERTDAEAWGISARALSEELLGQLDARDPDRADFMRLVGIVRTSGTALLDEYRAWRETHPELTQAMVHAGRNWSARLQRDLAAYLMEIRDATRY